MDIESAYTPAQYWGVEDNKLVPYAETNALDEKGIMKRVPTNDGMIFQMLAGNYQENVLALTGESLSSTENLVYKVVISGASSTVNALRYRCLVAGNVQSFGLVTIDETSHGLKDIRFFTTSKQTRMLLKTDKKAWRSEPVPGARHLLHAQFWPTFTRENNLPDEFPYLITEVYHRPGETTQQVKARMAQAWFDNLRRKTDIPLMPHDSPSQQHPWAAPLFSYFMLQKDLKWMTSIGPAVTKFHVKPDIKSVIAEAIGSGALPDIRDHIDFLDPRGLEGFYDDSEQLDITLPMAAD